MLGKSSRFFTAGYKKPKYMLPLMENENVFSMSVKSFESYFDSESFLFIVREDYQARNFVSNQASRVGIKDFRVKELAFDTRGQADSVFIGINDYKDDMPILIFNIDTIRYNFSYPDLSIIGDGFLEVFEGEGDNWSFVEPGLGTSVIRTTEKNRISNLCSNGLYFFKYAGDFRQSFKSYLAADQHVMSEIYIAPLYNYLIEAGRNINFVQVDPVLIDHCGIPEDYERIRNKQNIKRD